MSQNMAPEGNQGLLRGRHGSSIYIEVGVDLNGRDVLQWSANLPHAYGATYLQSNSLEQ